MSQAPYVSRYSTRAMLMAMLRAVMSRVAASTCGSIAPAYSAVQDPAALSSIQSPRVWLLSKIPAVTRRLHHRTKLRARACFAAGGRAETGLDALRLDLRVAPEAHRAEQAATPGPPRAQSVAPPPRR